MTVGDVFWMLWSAYAALIVVGCCIVTLLWMERRTYFTIIQTLESAAAHRSQTPDSNGNDAH